MTAKMSEARRRAFLSALRATGNQTLAAERAKVSRSWVQLQRTSDPEFRRDVADAVATAKVRLGGHAARRPPTGWGYLDGEELVVKGTGGPRKDSGPPGARHAELGGKRVQIARARLKQWSPRVEKRFLETLSATCNVKAACAEVGLTPASAYAHRQRWQGFADRWEQALDSGYAQLEAGLVFAAGNFLSGEPEVGPIRNVTMATALEMWEARGRHERARAAMRHSPLRARREPDIEEIRAMLLHRIAVIRQHDPQRLARRQAEWAARRDDGPGRSG